MVASPPRFVRRALGHPSRHRVHLEPGQKGITGEGGDLLTGIAPGEQPLQLQPGTAKLIKAGSTFMFQMHYTPTARPPRTARASASRFAGEPPQYRAMIGRALNFGSRFRRTMAITK